MSFGFGVGDFVQLGQLAWSVYKACKEAPESFGNISQEVLSLHAVLREVDETITGHELTQTQEAGLKTVGHGCHNVLTDLEKLVNKYESLGTQSKRTWDRMGWGFEGVADLRSRLTSSTVLLTAFMTTAQITVEKRLNKFLKEFKEGKHEGSVVTNQTMESLTVDEKQTWRMIRKELEGIGITIAAFDANKGFILEWFQAAMEAGAFEEQSYTQDDIDSEADPIPEISVSPKTPPLSLSLVGTTSNNAIKETGKAANGTMSRSSVQQVLTKAPMANARLKRGLRLTSLLSRVLSGRDLPEYISQGARDGDLNAVRSALRRGVSANLQDDDGNAPLYHAAANGDEPMVRLLLDNRANTNLPNRNGITPLNIAAECGSVGTVGLLIKSGADFMALGKYGDTPLHIAALHGQTSVAELLLLRGSDIEARANDGSTPLLAAITRGRSSMIVLLLKKGANINVITDRGDSVLHYTAFTRDLACFELLVEHGAAIDVKNNGGQTPLYTVIADKANSHLSEIAESKTIAIAQVLLDKGADIMTTVPWNTVTLLHWANSRRQARLLGFLLGRGADINAKHQGYTVLYEQVATSGDQPIIELLLNAGADINTRGPDGSTVLHLAARQWYADLGMRLILAGVDCAAKMNSGETALDIATKRDWMYAEPKAEFLAVLKSSMPELLSNIEEQPHKRTEIFEGFDFQV